VQIDYNKAQGEQAEGMHEENEKGRASPQTLRGQRPARPS
jgi:hypothetical protein